MHKIHPYLWFDGQAEEAVDFYCSVFPDAKKGAVSRYPEGSPGGMAGKVMIAECEIEGLKITALNGGPQFKFRPQLADRTAPPDRTSRRR